MTMREERDALEARIHAFLDVCASSPGTLRDAERDALMSEVARLQSDHVRPFQKLARARHARFDRGPSGWPALPTDVYRFAQVSLFAEAEWTRVFRTSGTTSGARGTHPFLSLALYDHAARIAADHALFAHAEQPMDFVLLAYSPENHGDSSLSHMLDSFATRAARDHGARVTWALDEHAVNVDALDRALSQATREGRPVALLGTSFAFVFAEDALASRGLRYALPEGSRLMFTGGFKGKSREVAPDELRAQLKARYGVRGTHLVSEYGMTELSSQLYGRSLLTLQEESPERLWAPPWMRITAVDPITLEAVPEGEVGILRIDDLANLDSCVSIQTADFGRVFADAGEGHRSVILLGRDPTSTPRGCSLAIEEALAQKP
jgi:hypothetical protein